MLKVCSENSYVNSVVMLLCILAALSILFLSSSLAFAETPKLILTTSTPNIKVYAGGLVSLDIILNREALSHYFRIYPETLPEGWQLEIFSDLKKDAVLMVDDRIMEMSILPVVISIPKGAENGTYILTMVVEIGDNSSEGTLKTRVASKIRFRINVLGAGQSLLLDENQVRASPEVMPQRNFSLRMQGKAETAGFSDLDTTDVSHKSGQDAFLLLLLSLLLLLLFIRKSAGKRALLKWQLRKDESFRKFDKYVLFRSICSQPFLQLPFPASQQFLQGLVCASTFQKTPEVGNTDPSFQHTVFQRFLR